MLSERLRAAAERGRPVNVVVVGCGKIATMFLAQVPRVAGIRVAAIVDLDPERARGNLAAAGWSAEQRDAVLLTDSVEAALDRPGLDVLVEATGDPLAGTRHALLAIARGLHLVMVNVEADVLVGPALAARARERELVYGMAWGDQPALIVDLVDWARVCGFPVVAAGKGTKYHPDFHASTPDTVWRHYGIAPERAAASGMNPKMFNSFLDGTKSSIEMAAVANATGLAVPTRGLGFPPCGTHDLPLVLRPRELGGQLEQAGIVEVVSSMERDGRPVRDDLRFGVYVVIEAPGDYAARCFADYGMVTDPTGRFTALWRPYHLIGLELAVSVARAGLLREATGSTREWRADVVACAKRDLAEGEVLDGEGGYCVWGRLVPAERSARERLLPIGLAHGIALRRPVARGALVTFDDVETPPESEALILRRELRPAP
jgi:predicted homoserine dehydrogenase-like protein